MYLLAFLLLFPSLVSAETYVAGFLGATVGAKGSGIDSTDSRFPAGSMLSDVNLKDSLVYGGKLGHYINRYLGGEVEAYTTTPDVKQQRITGTAPNGATLSATQPETDVRATTLAFNLIGRFPLLDGRLQPYAAVGLGIFFLDVGDVSDTVPGLNTQLGLRYLIDPHVSAFGEWKYTRADFSFGQTATSLGIDGTYSAHHLVFGVAYHFDALK